MHKFFKILLVGIGVLLLVFTFFLFGLKQILDQSTVKSLVVEKIEHVINLRVNYSQIDTVLFPFPGIQLKEIEITDAGKRVALVHDLLVEFDIGRIFQKEFQIHSIQAQGGMIFLTRAEDGSFPIASKFKSDAAEVEEGREKVEEGPKALAQYLPTTVRIKDFKLDYEDLSYSVQYELYIKELGLELNKEDQEVALESVMDLNQNSIGIKSRLKLTSNAWSLDDLEFNMKLSTKQFQFSKLLDMEKIFPKGDLRISFMDLDLLCEKNSKEKIEINLHQLVLGGIKSKKGDLYPSLNLNSSITLHAKDEFLKMHHFSFDYGDRFQVQALGELYKDFSKTFSLQIKSERLDFDKILPVIKILSHPDFSKSPPFQQRKTSGKIIASSEKKQTSSPNLNLLFDLKKINVAGNPISFLKGPVELKDQQVLFKNIDLGMYDGKANLIGNLNLRLGRLHMNAKLSGINVEKAVATATKDKLLKGRLRSDVVLDMNLKQTDVMGSMRLKSVFHISNGQLLGYANFIKPVAEVGKLFNFKGGKGESTEFESIDGSVYLANHQVQLHSFEMKGVGLNATGSGVYNEGGKIDMKFTVALAGVVGKAVKLPIIYRGYYGKNFAFIDPVWLATVYTGTMLGGPLGTVLGSVAGSQASERVDQTVTSVKNTFSDIKGFFFDEKKDSQTKK